MEKRQNEEREHRRPTEDKLMSRKTALLQYLRQILGRNLSILFLINMHTITNKNSIGIVLYFVNLSKLKN